MRGLRREPEAAERKALWGLVIASVAFSIWPFVMALVLTRENVRADVESWKTPVA